MTETPREARIRRRLRWQGLLARKSRVVNPNLDDLGGYMLVNSRNWVVAGRRHELTLDGLEARATDETEKELQALAKRDRAAAVAESIIHVGLRD